IKTLFILSFLILNIYLVSAFIGRQQEVSYLDTQELPIEDQLASEEITYQDIAVDETEATYISVSQKTLSEENLELLEEIEGQRIEVFNNNQIVAEIESPIEIPSDMTPEEIEVRVQENVLFGEDYEFWNWNEELDLLVFFQKKEGGNIYYNESGLLLIYLNEDNEATHYTQTILGEAEEQGDMVALNQPVQVIGILFKGNRLNRGDEITDINLGYHSRISADGIQVFAPTWEVEVNHEQKHFVNAIEGIIYDSDANE